MKASEIRDLADDQLIERIGETRRELFGLRFQHATGELENTSNVRNTKKDLARALTVARQRGLNVNETKKKSTDG